MSKSDIYSICRVSDSVAETLPSSLDVNYLLNLLSYAAAEEVRAYYQYRVVADFLVGVMRPDVERLFKTNAQDELDDHFQKLLKRISELGGNVETINSLSSFESLPLAPYRVPVAPYDVLECVEQNILSEKDAIARYVEICEFTQGKDLVTFRVSRQILEDEQEHLSDLEDLRDDILSSRKG